MSAENMTTDDPSPAAGLPAWRRYLSIAGSVFLGGVLLVAAWAKSIDPVSFASTIRAEGLEIVLPAFAVALIALFLEWALGAALLLAVRWRWVLIPTSGLVAFFLFLTGRKYWRWSQGLEVDSSCGCYGNLVQRTSAEAFWQDSLLMVPALLLAWLAVSARPPRLRLGVALFIGAAMTVFAWRAPELPIDHLATKLHEGMPILEHCVGADGDAQVCMDAILPEMRQGRHLVVLAALDDPSFIEAVPALNEGAPVGPSAEAPSLWRLSSADEDAVFTFRFTHGPIFELREAPEALIRPLYRRLPRSFEVEDGRVTATWVGLPPLESQASETQASETTHLEAD